MLFVIVIRKKEEAMRFENNGLEETLLSIDVNNTVNGGIVQTSVNIEEFSHEYIITIKIPSIKPENLKLRVYNKLLLVLHQMDYEVNLGGRVAPLTQILTKISLSPNAEKQSIDAFHRKNMLIVYVPKGENIQDDKKSFEIPII